MSKLKILHAADLHLDSPFEGLPEAKAALRRIEQRKLLGRIAALAESRQVQLVLLAGDLLDSYSPFTETAQELIKALGEINAPVIISPGNHDYYTQRSPYAKLSFPRNVHIFTKNEIECLELPELQLRVWGAAFTDKYSRPLLKEFSLEKKDGIRDIMCIHGEVAAASDYNLITEAQLAASKLDYVALGHIHQESGLKKAGGTYYAWPGCTEGRGFDECGRKNVYIVELDGGECALESVCIAARSYEILTVDISGAVPIQAIENRLPEDTEKDIYRIILRGETTDSPDIMSLRMALENRFFSLQLRDETRIKQDIWAKAGEDSLRGQFLQRLKNALEAAKDDEEKELIVQAARWGLAALDKREEVVRHDD